MYFAELCLREILEVCPASSSPKEIGKKKIIHGHEVLESGKS